MHHDSSDPGSLTMIQIMPKELSLKLLTRNHQLGLSLAILAQILKSRRYSNYGCLKNERNFSLCATIQFPFTLLRTQQSQKKITKSVISQVMRFINTSENYREKLTFQYDYNYFHNFFLPICKKQVCLSHTWVLLKRVTA